MQAEMELMCNCEDYKENMDLITFAASLAFRTCEVEYTGRPFTFCPWCGKGLFEPIKPTIKLMETSDAS